MKIFISTLIILFSAIFFIPRESKNVFIFAPEKYHNELFNYEIELHDFEINSQIPELVTLEKDSTLIRINAGCFDFGTETLTKSTEVTSVNGIPAMKENYYFQSQLKMQRISFEKEGQCFALELVAESEGDWTEVIRVARSFRFTN